MRSRRGGFSLVELLVVVLVVGILVRMALPAYHQVMLRARAAQALGEINAIRHAAYSYNSDTSQWPPDVKRGVVPPELVPYLGGDFTFIQEGYRLDWDNWIMPDGTPKHPNTGVLLGISVATDNEALSEALVRLVGESVAKYTIGQNYTFIIASS